MGLWTEAHVAKANHLQEAKYFIVEVEFEVEAGGKSFVAKSWVSFRFVDSDSLEHGKMQSTIRHVWFVARFSPSA